MPVWDKIKKALVEEDPAKVVSPPRAGVVGTYAPLPSVRPHPAEPVSYPPQPPPPPDLPYTPEPAAPPAVVAAPTPPPVSPSPAAPWPAPGPSPTMPMPHAASPTYAPPMPSLVAPELPQPQPVQPPSDPGPLRVSPAAVSPRTATSPSTVSVNMEQITGVYQKAGVPQAQYSSEQALRFLNTLPSDQPAANRRMALLGLLDSLQDTFPGISPETLVEDAQIKVGALEQASQVRGAEFEKFEATMEREIEQLREQIQQRQVAVEARRAKDQQLAMQCAEHVARLKKLVALLGNLSA